MTAPTTTFRWRSHAEKAAAGAYAAGLGLTLSQWLRRLALEAAGEPTDEPASAEAGRRMASGERDPWARERVCFECSAVWVAVSAACPEDDCDGVGEESPSDA